MTVLHLATLGDATQIEMILSVALPKVAKQSNHVPQAGVIVMSLNAPAN
jgi:hypothetical protein